MFRNPVATTDTSLAELKVQGFADAIAKGELSSGQKYEIKFSPSLRAQLGMKSHQR